MKLPLTKQQAFQMKTVEDQLRQAQDDARLATERRDVVFACILAAAGLDKGKVKSGQLTGDDLYLEVEE